MIDPIVAIHGTGGRREHFAVLAAAMPKNRSLCPLSLPGHSGPKAQDGVSTVAKAAYRMAPKVPVESVVLGHSLGGIVALTMAAHGLIRPRAMVLIDSNLPTSFSAEAANLVKAQQAASSDWRTKMVAGLQRDWPITAGPQQWRERVFADLAQTPEASIRQLWSDGLRARPLTLWRAVRVPTLYLRSTRAVEFRGLSTLTSNTTLVDVPGGHWPHLTHAAETVQVITRFLDRLD